MNTTALERYGTTIEVGGGCVAVQKDHMDLYIQASRITFNASYDHVYTHLANRYLEEEIGEIYFSSKDDRSAVIEMGLLNTEAADSKCFTNPTITIYGEKLHMKDIEVISTAHREVRIVKLDCSARKESGDIYDIIIPSKNPKLTAWLLAKKIWEI